MKNLLLIDGHYLLFRSFAAPFKFNSSKGTPLHLLTMYLKYLRTYVEASRADCVLVCFDSKGKTDNHQLSKEYKANRKLDYSADEDNPFLHMDNLKIMLARLGISYIERPGVEADDLIASASKTYMNANIFIGSNDTDFYQLLSDRVSCLKLNKGNVEVIGSQNLVELYGIMPSQYVRWKSLVGDSADNIKGIPRVGVKTASKIINGEVNKELTEYQDIIDLNTQLITLNSELEIPFQLEDLNFQSVDLMNSNKELFNVCGF